MHRARVLLLVSLSFSAVISYPSGSSLVPQTVAAAGGGSGIADSVGWAAAAGGQSSSSFRSLPRPPSAATVSPASLRGGRGVPPLPEEAPMAAECSSAASFRRILQPPPLPPASHLSYHHLQNPPPPPVTVRTRCLVIGVSDCSEAALRLPSAAADAAALADSLRTAGAEVLLLLSPSRLEILGAIAKLSDVMRPPLAPPSLPVQHQQQQKISCTDPVVRCATLLLWLCYPLGKREQQDAESSHN